MGARRTGRAGGTTGRGTTVPGPGVSPDPTARGGATAPGSVTAPGGGTAPAPQRRSVVGRLAVAVLVAVLAVVLFQVLRPDQRPSQSLGGPVVPHARTDRAEVGPVPEAWRATGAARATVQWQVDGLSSLETAFVVTSRTLVLRLGDRWGDEDATGVVGISRADGRTLWSLDLPGALCAVEPLSIDGSERVACAGAGRLVVLDPLSGEVVAEVRHAVEPAAITTAEAGVVLVGATDARTGSTVVAWYDTNGERLWSVDLAVEDPGFLEDLRDSDDGYVAWRFHAARVADALLLAHDDNAYRLEADGPDTEPVDCYALVVDETGYVCSAWRSSARFDHDGRPLWDDGPALAREPFGMEVYVSLAEESVQSDGYAYRPLDSVTGRTGEEVWRSSSWTHLNGTPEVPIGAGRDGLVRFAPDTGEVMWWRDFDTSNGDRPTIAGDRLLISDTDTRETAILDATTGAEVHRTDARMSGCRAVAGRELLCWDTWDLRLVVLP